MPPHVRLPSARHRVPVRVAVRFEQVVRAPVLGDAKHGPRNPLRGVEVPVLLAHGEKPSGGALTGRGVWLFVALVPRGGLEPVCSARALIKARPFHRIHVGAGKRALLRRVRGVLVPRNRRGGNSGANCCAHRVVDVHAFASPGIVIPGVRVVVLAVVRGNGGGAVPRLR